MRSTNIETRSPDLIREESPTFDPLDAPIRARRFWTAVLVTAVVVFLGVAPTLPLLDFSGGSESLVVATALETRRTGHWLVPTLQGTQRLNKPPLTTWLTAIALRDETRANLTDADPDTRDGARLWLHWEARWPTLLAACAALLAAADLGRRLTLSYGNRRSLQTGVATVAVLGSCIIFLQYARSSTTDVQLFCWVALANALLARALIPPRDAGVSPSDGISWASWLGAGLAIGLAFMSKGPVALAQTAAPAAVFAIWRWGTSRREGSRRSLPVFSAPKRRGQLLCALVLSTACAAAVGLPWFAMVLHSRPDVLNGWTVEITREGATDLASSSPFNYLILFALAAPWTTFFIAGIGVAVRDVAASLKARTSLRRHDGIVFGLLLVIVPILIMTTVRDRKARYLLPMAAPVAVLAAHGFAEHLRTRKERDQGTDDAGKRHDVTDFVVIAGHWAFVMLFAVGLPIAGGFSLRSADGGHWYKAATASGMTLLLGTCVLAAILLHRRRPGTLPFATLGIMLIVQALFIIGYRNTTNGLSEMKPLADLILRRVPGATLLSTGMLGDEADVKASGKDLRQPTPRIVPHADRPGEDLSIYLNQTIGWRRNVKDIPVRDKIVVLVRRREAEHATTTKPSEVNAGLRSPIAGYSILGTTLAGSSRWYALVREEGK